jgi:cellulose synthase/poly-beta-1,6-N-acetylglucosamine synthase-like glycosyltransferase
MLLSALALLIGIPVLVLLIEVVASLRTPNELPSERVALQAPARLAVIVPAHNESSGIIPTLRDIRSQLGAGDRLIVVADNCTDDTAAIAKAENAEVTRRDEPTRIGKGYAMGWGISHLQPNPPDLVMFVDADCRLQADFVRRMKLVCQLIRRPVQALYLMHSGEGSSVNHNLAEFAWILKNWARPLGLRNFGCPVQLMGTGMIFPWDVINGAQLASGNVVEDMKLGLDMAASGKAPYFFPFVKVTSEFPVTTVGTESQRQRWVQGHLATILSSAPRLLGQALRHGRFDLLALTLDLLIPPLSLLALLVMAMFGVTLLLSLFGFGVLPLLISAGNFVAFSSSVVLAWFAFGQQVLPRRELRSIGPFFARKVRFYGRLFSGKTASRWIRTDRTRPK